MAESAERLDALLAAFTPDRPGLAIVVSRGGEPLFERYLGAADLEHGAPVTAASRFHVASVSKPFTALAAMRLAQAGKVDLTADIRTLLPELVRYGEAITAAQLAHHTSGLRDQWDLLMLAGTPLDGLIRQEAILAIAAAQSALNFPPGTDIRYSNTGYSLLAEIVSRTAGVPFRQYLQEAVFAPLGMAQTFVYDDASQIVPGRAMSYALGPDGAVGLARLNYSNYGATSVHATASDLVRFGRELLHPSVLGAELISAIQTPGRLNDGRALNYAFGLMVEPVAGRRALSHMGADAGYRASFAAFPDDDAVIVVLSNGQADVSKIGETLAEVVLGPNPNAGATVDPGSARIERLAAYYVSDWGPGMLLEVRDGELVRLDGRSPPSRATFLADGRFHFGMGAITLQADGSLAERQSVGGLELLWRKARRATPSTGELETLEGRYRSEELDVTYRLSARKGGIVLTSLRAAPIPLSPADTGCFDGPALRLAVDQNARGRATGFTLSTGRVRGLEFKRLDPD